MKPPIDGPFYAIEARNIDTEKMDWLVATDSTAVCPGNFSVVATCHSKEYAEFIAWACNNVNPQKI